MTHPVRQGEVIVTGSRQWPTHATRIIWQMLAAHNPSLVVHGGCTEGADEMAEAWSRRSEVDSRIVRARWTTDTGGKLDRGAGHARNSRMLELYPDAPVLAFPFGKASGTRGCMRRAVELGHAVFVFTTAGQLVPATEWF
jgi:hypothetical protein